ncbi:hypothetical protein [Desulfosarcina sp.]|uniref:hypothetical protein n=1 Tax=Desulfosarcina sp. TaxID=2027861 RepID=UPI00397094EB
MTAIVQIKGIREGLLVTLGDGTWLELKAALVDHINRQGDFLRGGRLALDVGNQALGPVELCGLRDQLSEQGLSGAGRPECKVNSWTAPGPVPMPADAPPRPKSSWPGCKRSAEKSLPRGAWGLHRKSPHIEQRPEKNRSRAAP